MNNPHEGSAANKVTKSGDTMTGDLTFSGNQKIIGGTSTTADLTLQTTSGVGTTGADMHFLVGNNGATEAMTVLNSGNVGIGTASPDMLIDLESADTNETGIEITNTSVGGKSWRIRTMGSGAAGRVGNLSIRNATDLLNAIEITPACNIGIGGAITNINSKLTFVAATTAAGGILFGTDTNLYRSAADTLKTDDSFIASSGLFANNSGGVAVAGITSTGILEFGSGTATRDTNLYRSAADTLKTDDSLIVTGSVQIDAALDHNGTTVGFYGVTPVTRPTELTDELTTITHTAPGTPDYAIQNMTNVTPYGFVTQDEANTLLSVVANLQTRVNELETKLTSLGLLIDAD